MVWIHFSFTFMVFIIFSKDIATAKPPEYCSLITSEIIKLSIFDLEDIQMKTTLYINITEFENQTIDQFLDYLENVQSLSLSSHVASVRSGNTLKDIPIYSTTPLSTPLCRVIDVLNKEAHTERHYILYVGAESSKRQTLTRRFLKGLLIDSSTGLFKVGILSPVIVDQSYQPVQENPSPSIHIDKKVIESVQTTESATSSQNEVFSEVSALIVSVSTEYSKQKSSKSNNLVSSRKALVSLSCNKKGIFVAENRIDLNPSFLKEMYEIVDNLNVPPFTRTQRVVKLLNQYGWYVANHFVLGGRLDIVKTLENQSVYKENEDLEHLEGQLHSAYLAYNGGLGASNLHSSSTKNTKSFFSSNERITSTVDQAMDLPSFMENVQNDENWRIIAVKNFLPTCKILLKKHSSLMTEIKRLIISYAHHQRIKKMQPNIDMVEYVNNIMDEYVQPF